MVGLSTWCQTSRHRLSSRHRHRCLPPTGNSIRLNSLSGNAPNDIYGDSTGTGNTISGNTCTKTNLTGAC